MKITRTLVGWRQQLLPCEPFFDFIIDLHQAMGFKPGVYATPDLLLQILRRMTEQCQKRNAEAKARIIDQLSEFGRTRDNGADGGERGRT